MKKTKRLITVLLIFTLVLSMSIPVMAASKVKINKTKTTMYVGQTTTLKISGTKSKAKWSSSKKSVATVTSKGTVTAKKKGFATITAKIGNKKYTCKVTVKNPYLNKTTLSLDKGDTYTLKLTGSKVKLWTSSNKSVATVNNKGKVTAKKNGTTTITAKASNNKKYTCKVTVNASDNNDGSGDNTDNDSPDNDSDNSNPDDSTPDNGNPDDSTHEHKYTSQITKQPTCTETGIKTFTCSCGNTYTEIIPATGHNFSDKVIAPTCTELGYTIHTCSKCGYSFIDNYIDALGHNYECVITKEGTCVTLGEKTYTCSRCGEKYMSQFAGNHDYEWVVTKEATCTEDGEKSYKCKYCGDVTQTTSIPAKHSYGDWTITKEPSSGAATTAADFGTRQRTCSVCNHVDEQTIINIDLGNGETKQMCGVFADDMAYETFQLTNELRKSLGLNELTWLDTDGAEAGSKLRAVEISYSFSHDRPNGEFKGWGENILLGTDNATDAMDAWINSPGHYANLTNSNYKRYRAACFKSVYSDGNPYFYWVQIFL